MSVDRPCLRWKEARLTFCDLNLNYGGEVGVAGWDGRVRFGDCEYFSLGDEDGRVAAGRLGSWYRRAVDGGAVDGRRLPFGDRGEATGLDRLDGRGAGGQRGSRAARPATVAAPVGTGIDSRG